MNPVQKRSKPKVGEMIQAKITGFDDYDLEAEWL